jgi:hypothetical protein
MHQFACPIIHIFKIHTIATGAGDGAKYGALFADTHRIIWIKVTHHLASRRRLQCLADDR